MKNHQTTWISFPERGVATALVCKVFIVLWLLFGAASQSSAQDIIAQEHPTPSTTPAPSPGDRTRPDAHGRE